jgi:hypothetical protein
MSAAAIASAAAVSKAPTSGAVPLKPPLIPGMTTPLSIKALPEASV